MNHITGHICSGISRSNVWPTDNNVILRDRRKHVHLWLFHFHNLRSDNFRIFDKRKLYIIRRSY